MKTKNSILSFRTSALCLLVLISSELSSRAQFNFTGIVPFQYDEQNVSDGGSPVGNLIYVPIPGVSTNIYGTTTLFWKNGNNPGYQSLFGSVYSCTPSDFVAPDNSGQKPATGDAELDIFSGYDFSGIGCQDGSTPMGGVVMSPDGKWLYGTTSSGGGSQNQGTVFVMAAGGVGGGGACSPTSGYVILHIFGSAANDGSGPVSGLTLSADGTTLYGTTSSGETANLGTVFAIQTTYQANSGQIPVPVNNYSFVSFPAAPAVGPPGDPWPMGACPMSDLALQSQANGGGWLYGTACLGGLHGFGTIFTVQIQPGAPTYLYGPYVIYNFKGQFGQNPQVRLDGDGGYPSAGLLYAQNIAPPGNAVPPVLYGTTAGLVNGPAQQVNNPYNILNFGSGTVFALYVNTDANGNPKYGDLTYPYSADNMLWCRTFQVPQNGNSAPSVGDLCWEYLPRFSSSTALNLPGYIMGTIEGDGYNGIQGPGSIFDVDFLGLNPPTIQTLPADVGTTPRGGLCPAQVAAPLSLGLNTLTFYGTASKGLPSTYGSVFQIQETIFGDPIIAFTPRVGPRAFVTTWKAWPNTRLQTTHDLHGPWTDVIGATSPYTNQMTGTQAFYRLAVSPLSVSFAPGVTTMGPVGVSNTSATFVGTVNPIGTASSYWFNYGTTTNYGNTTVATSVGTNFLYVSNLVSGLTAGVTYHYQIVATNSVGSGTGEDMTITTVPIGGYAPSAATLMATSVTSSNAVFNGTVTANGADTPYWWEYGSTTNYGLVTPYIVLSKTNNGATAVSALVSNLPPGTYHFQLLAWNPAGSAAGGDVSVTNCIPPPPGLVNWWTGNGNFDDEVSGDTASWQPGTPSNPFTTGTNGGAAFNFDGTNFLETSLTYTDPQDFTLDCWFKTAGTAGGVLIGFSQDQNDTGGQYDRILYMTDDGILHFGIWDGGQMTVDSPGSYNDGAWHNVAATLSSTGGAVLYVDGVEVANNPSETPAENYSGYWRIGEDNMNNWTDIPANTVFTGAIEQISIYNIPLSAGQIQDVYNAGPVGNCN